MQRSCFVLYVLICNKMNMNKMFCFVVFCFCFMNFIFIVFNINNLEKICAIRLFCLAHLTRFEICYVDCVTLKRFMFMIILVHWLYIGMGRWLYAYIGSLVHLLLVELLFQYSNHNIWIEWYLYVINTSNSLNGKTFRAMHVFAYARIHAIN